MDRELALFIHFFVLFLCEMTYFSFVTPHTVRNDYKGRIVDKKEKYRRKKFTSRAYVNP